jgi:hypothetical protein
MHRIACLIVVAFIAGVSLISMAGSAAAEANCPQGATCKCVPTKFTKCKADAQGNQYDCKEYQGEKCTVISGPGSGKPAASLQPGVVAQPDQGTVPQADKGIVAQPATGAVAEPDTGAGTPPDKVKGVGSKRVAPATSR